MSIDMNRMFNLRKEDAEPRWHLVDAQGKVLGRLATEIADLLRGKGKPTYTPHTANGDYVVVINADKVVLTGNKLENKTYIRVTGWMGGKKELTAKHVLSTHPERIIESAVAGMMADNIINDRMIKNLKVYVGTEHPHKAHFAQKTA
jgi:large subunit ribosomal protein L13